MTSIAIIGASKDRNKFGNKAVRAYKDEGFTVFPINPKEKEIEGLKCFGSVGEIPEKIDSVSLYLPPERSMMVLDEILKKKPAFVYINPGTEHEEFEERLRKHSIEPRRQCSILAIGRRPEEFT